jgi:hypothetical protein
MKGYREINAGRKPFKKAYVAVMLWVVGRAIQAAGRVDESVKAEFDALPEGFSFSLGVEPGGPCMIVGKNAQGHPKYLGWKPEGKRIDLKLRIKNIEAAMLLFSFRESTAVASARNRLIVDGEVSSACAAVRILDIVEVYLLPRMMAKLAVKRYPVWTPWRKYIGRFRIYFRSLLGY